jgi:hypothetical protein
MRGQAVLVNILGDALRFAVKHRFWRAVPRFTLMKKFTLVCAVGHIVCDLLWLLIDNGFLWSYWLGVIKAVAIASRVFAMGFVAGVAWFIAKKWPERDQQAGS